MGTWQTVAADRGDIGMRIDLVLLRHLSRIPGVTRNRLQRLIDRGAVRVNGRIVTKAAARVGLDDVIAIELPDPRPRQPTVPENLPIDIRYEDDDLLVVNKPPGQVSHPAKGHASGTLLNGLLAYAHERWTPGLVSRLDKGTSGLIVVAKRQAMHTALQRLAQANGIEKEYLAIVQGKPPLRGTIDVAIDRDPWDERRVTVRDRGGVPSVTRFERVRYVSSDSGVVLTLLRCRLVTGRMHQIRVHLAAKGWPIVGDAVYGVTFAGMTRQALHAWRVAFAHPSTGARVEISAPPPLDMASLLERFEAGKVG